MQGYAAKIPLELKGHPHLLLIGVLSYTHISSFLESELNQLHVSAIILVTDTFPLPPK